EAEMAKALLEFARELAGDDGMEAVLDRVDERSAAILGSPRTSVWIQDPETGEFAARAVHGYEADQREEVLAVRYSAALTEAIADAPEPFMMLAGELSELTGNAPVRLDFAIAPLVLDGDRRGCIAAAVPLDRTFGDRELGLLAGIAHQARLAVANAVSFESLEGT